MFSRQAKITITHSICGIKRCSRECPFNSEHTGRMCLAVNEGNSISDEEFVRFVSYLSGDYGVERLSKDTIALIQKCLDRPILK